MPWGKPRDEEIMSHYAEIDVWKLNLFVTEIRGANLIQSKSK